MPSTSIKDLVRVIEELEFSARQNGRLLLAKQLKRVIRILTHRVSER
jgi:hypothetical protein